MKLTPLDIHHKEFRHALRGYNEDEVDQFLDQVADEFERLFKENIDLNEKLEALQQRVNEFELQRQTINNTLVNAQRSAEEIIARADTEADTIVAHANTRAKELVNDALEKKQQVRSELLRIKQAEESFRERYKLLLESNLKAITEVSLADDVSVLLSDADEVRSEYVPAPVPAPAPAPAPKPRAAAPSAATLPQAAESAAGVVMIPVPPTQAPEAQPEIEALGDTHEMLPVVPLPTPGFVQSVTLGEIDAPEIPADVDLVEPSEFTLPGFAALGEREDDMDIEEID